MATDTTQRRINIRNVTSEGFVLWHQVTVENVTVNDKTELFDVPENCRIIGAAARTVSADSGTTLTVQVEADDNGGPTALLGAVVALQTADDADELAAANVGLLLSPLTNEKFVTLQVDVVAATAPGGDGVLWFAAQLVRTDYDRS